MWSELALENPERPYVTSRCRGTCSKLFGMLRCYTLVDGIPNNNSCFTGEIGTGRGTLQMVFSSAFFSNPLNWLEIFLHIIWLNIKRHVFGYHSCSVELLYRDKPGVVICLVQCVKYGHATSTMSPCD